MPLTWSESQPTLTVPGSGGSTLTLRPWAEADADTVFEACQDAEIQRWTRVPVPYMRAHAEGFVGTDPWEQRTGASFAVVDAADGTVLGSCGLVTVNNEESTAEVGYWVAPRGRRRGVAAAAARAVAGWALDVLGAQRVTLEAAAGNEGSLRVAAAAGFTREGVQRSKAQRFDERFDMVLFSVLPGEIRPIYEIAPSRSLTPLAMAGEHVTAALQLQDAPNSSDATS